MSAGCPASGDLVAVELARIATEYREADRLRGYMAAVLKQIEDIARATCAIPDYFDLNTAVGEQLTFVGKRMGFPRCHCVCNARPVIGFACDDPAQAALFPIVGFCDEGAWLGCGGVSDLCINDDEVYRAHLFARRYQMLGLFDIQSLGAALKNVWGPTAWIPQAGDGRVVIAPGRALTNSETSRLLITLRALPIAPGISIAIHFGDQKIAGFGAGWFGFCSSVPSQKVFGFDCEDGPNARPIAGFCDPDGTWVNCAPPVVSEGYWLCPVPVDPYSCDDATVSPPVHGFVCPDSRDDRPLTGFCDTSGTWADCLPA